MELSVGKYALSNDITEKIESVSNSESSKQIIDGLKHSSKEIYDHVYKNNILVECQSKALRKLLIDGFDSEQIFQQIELQNKSAFEHFNKCVSFIDDEYTCTNGNHLNSSDDEIKVQTYSKSELSEDKEYVFDDDSDLSGDDFPIPEASTRKIDKSADSLNLSNSDEEDGDFLENMSQSEEEEENVVEVKKMHKKDESKEKHHEKFHSVVDDQFFKLSNLAQFLRVEDIKAEHEEEKSDDEGINYFEDMLSDNFDDSEDEMDEEGIENKVTVNFNLSLNYKFMSKNYFGIYRDEDDDNANDILNEIEQEEENNSNLTPKTPFEIEQEKIKKTVHDFEEKMIQKPDWHLTGEVTASSRPKDSLLHQDTDFDSSAKPVLVEDEDLLNKTEKAIISIIKNKAYSDGQRVVKPINDFTSSKKEIVLDQSKSKKSLAQVYEEDYLKKKYGEQEQENPKHVEIKKMMDFVLPELQALFCHIPKPAIPDIKIVSNLPAITVEEVAPTSISDVTLLAPEEIKKKTGTVKGQSERSDSDRKRERRKKKMFQRMKFKKMENDGTGLNLSGKASKLDKMNTLKKLKQNRNTKLLEVGEEKIKSSKDFFSRLQDSVHSEGKPSHSKKKRIK
nr:U3 small nucleolar ribonucleoprotein protein MPP10 [Parasteatoda tepidariorum]